MTTVHHADEPAARLEHPVNLPDDLLRMLAVVNDSPRVDEIEPAVLERQHLGVLASQLGLQAVERQMLPCGLDGGVGEIDTVAAATRARPLQMVGAGAHPDLEHRLPAM